jgi:CubicO group peptidase (beta-lactamase class C family)
MSAPADAPLPAPTVALPGQPDDVAWPTLAWATGEQCSGDPDRLEAVVDRAFRRNPSPELALSLGFVAVQGGRIVAERYSRSTRSTSTLISWSTAKSVTHAALGILLSDGRIDLDVRPVAPEWGDGADPRGAIGLRDLLAMRSGLRFNEDYVDADTSHCLEMLYGSGAHDVAGYAASQPLEHPVDTVWNYSSGTTNIISRLIGSTVGGGREGMERFLHEELFGPIGMASAEPRFDEAGTWVGSSYLYATARDFARFGYLYLRDGVWDGRRILPEGWVDDARTPTSPDGEGGFYGHQWWVAGDERGQFSANGYEGQRIVVVPSLDLVVVRLGKSPIEHAPALAAWLGEVVAAFE